nr:MAG TPA: hypothetical protein [Caudoviricetes sp.]
MRINCALFLLKSIDKHAFYAYNNIQEVGI